MLQLELTSQMYTLLIVAVVKLYTEAWNWGWPIDPNTDDIDTNIAIGFRSTSVVGLILWFQFPLKDHYLLACPRFQKKPETHVLLTIDAITDHGREHSGVILLHLD